MDTIFAQASAPGKAGVSIVRISGPLSRDAAAHFGVQLKPIDRKLASIKSRDGELIDKAFVLSFERGSSFTGEDVVELHLHGSPAIVSSVMAELQSFGCRLAEPGEFTRRALENGRLDLAQVEGLADLIEAETEEQRKQAIRVFDGALGALVEAWRSRLVRAAALLEATIDFVDEDVPEDVLPEVRELLTSVRDELVVESAGVALRERVRDGFEVGIVGPPNVGKSTLINRLAGREAAITSSVAGTTRDVIEVRMDLKGLPVTFLDTAGIREARDEIEGIGIKRGLERAEQADLRIHLIECDGEALVSVRSDDIVLVGKSDLYESIYGVSGLTGSGVDELVDAIGERLAKRVRGAGVSMRQRHFAAVETGLDLISSVLNRLESSDVSYVDLLAEDLRTAIRALESLVGRIDAESLLDEIFSSFCIGK